MLFRSAVEFFRYQIFKIQGSSPATRFGNNVHNAIRLINNKMAGPDNFEGEVKKAVENMILATEELKKQFPGLDFLSDKSEQTLAMPLQDLIAYSGTPMEFNGKMDAVFKHDKGILIVDYKTDINNRDSAKHKRQLAAYKKMYSKLFNEPEHKISTCVMFVALRGGVNTGKFDCELDFGKRDVFSTFEEHLLKIIGWKQDPQSFINELVGQLDDTPLNLSIKQKLA